MNDIIAGAPQGYRRRARLSLNCPPDKPLQMGFRKAGSSDIVNVEQCPVLAQLCSIAAQNQGVSGGYGTRHLGHVERVVQAGSGTLMILHHTAPLSAADKEKLERFRILRDCLFLAPFGGYWKRYLAKRHGMIRTAYVWQPVRETLFGLMRR